MEDEVGQKILKNMEGPRNEDDTEKGIRQVNLGGIQGIYETDKNIMILNRKAEETAYNMREANRNLVYDRHQIDKIRENE